jgi:hypothetical protein
MLPQRDPITGRFIKARKPSVWSVVVLFALIAIAIGLVWLL